MIGSRLLAVGCLTFLTLPSLCFGQSKFDAPAVTAPDSSAASVSVRELKIPEKARNLYNKGIQKFADKDWPGCIVEFQRAIAAYADFYEAYYKIGLADLELNLSAKAEAAFHKSIELSEGRFAPALFGLGLTLGNEKQFDDALAFIRAGLDLEPSSSRGNFTLAWVLYTADRVPEAEKSVKAALVYNPNFAIAHLLLAQIHLRQNNSAAMVDDLDAYLRIEPDNPRSPGVRAVRDKTAQALPQVPQVNEATIVAAGPR
jgi:tetratricopeptide (TPR) repeat protein